ncbi:DUF2207 domain-containing protein [Enemella evansiae]|uniref:DUF2207 domain-containing protein n=1 Tax=Enemella evansiae TaxID=2016499 RepID=UPI000B968115|nr:DUF2207 domain-containing protein [Enemella evansiae]OYO02273.1 hypothetical protein CGZ96_02705 [Enemella evansiae]
MFSRTSDSPARRLTVGVRLAAVLILALGLLLPAAPAHAEDTPESWAITDYRVDATLQRDGEVRVRLDLAFDFADEPGRGPFLTFPLRQRVADNPDLWRQLSVTVDGVSSPTGANTNLARESDSDGLTLKVGEKNTRFTGVQRYVVDYTLRGVTTPNNPVSGLDELNWNLVGPAWQVPIRNVRASVTGPVDTERVACFTGKDFTRPCTAESADGVASFAASDLATETGVQIVAGYPAGTLAGAEPRFSKRMHPGNMFPLTAATGTVTALLSAVALGLVALRVRRSGDRAYAGLTPGLRPAAGAEGAPTVRRARTPVAVRFTPPEGVRPAEAGTLIDHTVDSRDITATVIDLAVRGHLVITQVGKKDWRLDRVESADPLRDYEAGILEGLFQDGPEVTTKQLRDKAYAEVLNDGRSDLQALVASNGWYPRSPASTKARIGVGAVALIVAGAAGGAFIAGLWGWGLLGLPLVLAGLALLATMDRQVGRTAEGSAVLAQVQGFEQFLRTADADKLRWEEGEDIFSRYLPWAIVFGVAERWTRIFAELAEQGRYDGGAAGWYVGSTPGFQAATLGAFAATDGFSAAMSSSLSASVSAASSSSGSGFSGGGGAGGGGGGGW